MKSGYWSRLTQKAIQNLLSLILYDEPKQYFSLYRAFSREMNLKREINWTKKKQQKNIMLPDYCPQAGGEGGLGEDKNITIPYLLQAQSALALLLFHSVGRIGTESFPAPSTDPMIRLSN